MNTYEIRNMSTNQWAYWCSALPLTVLVVLVASLWAGLLTLPFKVIAEPNMLRGGFPPVTMNRGMGRHIANAESGSLPVSMPGSKLLELPR